MRVSSFVYHLKPEATMDFTEHELLELLTAVADQRSHYLSIANDKRRMGALTPENQKHYHDKAALSGRLYDRLQAMLLALETSETL
jgi:hypothetical protein